MAVLSDKIAMPIIDALGLKHVRKLVLTLEHRKVATVSAEFYPEHEGLRDIEVVLEDFELVKKDGVVLHTPSCEIRTLLSRISHISSDGDMILVEFVDKTFVFCNLVTFDRG